MWWRHTDEKRTGRPLPVGLLLVLTGVLCFGCGKKTTPSVVMEAMDGKGSTPDYSAWVEPEVVETGPLQPPVVEGDPGRVTLHRLNRAEYNNTVRDLLGTELQPADDFPNDDHGYGFDNNADVLSMSPLLFELYEHAAELLIAETMEIPVTDPASFHFEAEDVEHTTGGASGADAWNIWSNGEALGVAYLPASGTYTMRAYGYGQQAGPDDIQMTFSIDGVIVAEIAVTNDAQTPQTFEASFYAEEGLRQIGVGFANDFYIPGGEPCESNDECESGTCKGNDTCGSSDRNLIIDWFDVTGPSELADTTPVNAQREAVMVCTPDEAEPATCVREILRAFGKRAWRRPLEEVELDGLLVFLTIAEQEGADWEEGLRTALRAILVSPHFIFRVEIDPDPVSLEEHPLSQYELASRLSYFLWSSMPDASLLAAADQEILHLPEVLHAQVQRMLKDPRAQALVENFGGQWLYFRALDDVAPDPWYFPGWNEGLRTSMRAEAWLFFHSFIRGERSMLELLTASDSFIDETLAAHYQLDGFFGMPGAMLEMDVSDNDRGGVLRQGALLTALSYPTRTSPVRRGKWVLGQLLCEEPPPPPPGVEGLSEEEIEAGNMTLREVLELHRADPVCAACHLLMDPIGLGFENYDGIGRWRTEESGLPVDPAGELPDGSAFLGPEGLIDILVADPSYTHCMVEQLATYALGRGVEPTDHDYLEAIAEVFEVTGHHFDDLAYLIATSAIFTHRRGEPETPADGGAP